MDQKLQELSGGLTKHSYTPFAFRFYDAMVNSVKEGNGKFLLQSGDMCIYVPRNWEGAKCLRRANPDEVKLCTTYLDKSSYYDQYARSGIQNYILTPDNLYLFFVKTRHHSSQATEFADYKNNHDFAPLNNFKSNNNISVLAKPMIDNNPLKVNVLGLDNKEGYQLLTDWVIGKHSLEGMDMCSWAFSRYDFAEMLITELKEVYHEIPERMDKSIRQKFDKNVIYELTANDILPMIYTSDDYPEFHYDVNILFGQLCNNQPISTREQASDVLSKIATDLHTKIMHYTKDKHNRLGIDEEDEYEDILFSGEPSEYVTPVNQLISNNFPTFTDPQDIDNWLDHMNVPQDQRYYIGDSLEMWGILESSQLLTAEDCHRIGLHELMNMIN